MATHRGTPEEVRTANLAAVLGLLHRNGPQSRAALSRATGRNRSTMASLVGDLVELELVDERDPDPQGVVGRPSPVVSVRSDVVAVAVNPEIDALTIGLVGLDGGVRRVIRHGYDRIPTAAEVISITAAVVAGMSYELDAMRVVGIGVAVPGQVNTTDGSVRIAPHLGWRGEAFAEPLSEATGLSVRVANDAGLGALAEHRFGAGKGRDHLIYLNGGASGIGGGVIVDGALLCGASGFAGELGHIRVSGASQTDTAGFAGTLEALVTRAELMDALGLTQAGPDEFEQALLADRSPAVQAIVTRQLNALGAALAAAINLFNPNVIALGGFLAALQAYDAELLRACVAACALEPSLEAVEIVPARLRSNLLMVGAAGMAFEELLADPTSGRGR